MVEPILNPGSQAPDLGALLLCFKVKINIKPLKTKQNKTNQSRSVALFSLKDCVSAVNSIS